MSPGGLEEFGLALRRQRRASMMTQATLADRSGVDRTYVSGIERGIRNPTLTCVFALARALDIRASELLATAEGMG